MAVRVIHDNSHRAVQAMEVAKWLGNVQREIIITVGLDKIDEAVAAKRDSGAFLVSMLDPGRGYEEFDLIFVPEHDPHPELGNVRTTVGLVNQVTPSSLAAHPALDAGSHEETPHQVRGVQKTGLLIGGRHVGGNFSVADAKRLADILNTLLSRDDKTEVMITTSKRTEEKAIEALKKQLKIPYYIYDYNKNGAAANPYYRILSAADKIIVTADSVRMCSEAASSGKQIFIFTPEQTHFSYLALRDSLFNAGAAIDVKNLLDNTPTTTLNEAKRVAEIIVKEINDRKI